MNWKRLFRLTALALIVALTSTGASLAAPAGALLQEEKVAKEKKDKKDKKSNKSSKEAEGEADTGATGGSSEAGESGGKKKKKKKDSVETEASAEPTSNAEPTSKKSGKSKKNSTASSAAPTAKGQPMLWRGHADSTQLNLFWGPGGESGVPKPPFTFIKEDMTGTNPKIKVTDANGVKWNVKFDEEVHAEVAASRIAWACGYKVEESYFVASGNVSGVRGLTRAKKFVAADGSFTNAMFENRPDTVARRNIRWTWESNPFVGTKEMSGLAILNVLLNNWDAKVDNNNVLGMYGEDGQVYDWYVQSDWGGTFGKTGGYFSHTKWSVPDYTKQAFISGASGGRLSLHYTGKMGSALKSVPIEHAKWFAGVIGQLSDEQIRDAFRAAGASDQEIAGFSTRVRQKINELTAAVGR